MTRVPATLREAQEALRQADPPSMTPLMEGYRDHEWASADGDVAQRRLLIHSEARQPQAQRTVNKQLRKQRDQEVQAFRNLCGTTLACEADAPQALSTFEQGLQATVLEQRTVRPTPRDGQRGRPGQGALPAHMVYAIEGALASRFAARQALLAQQRGFILATNELDDTRLPPQDLLEGYKGQGHVERGFRFLKDPCFLASSRYLKKPERIMALLMVMTVCLLVYAAVAYRIRHALQEQGATFPDQQGTRTQHPTARWVFQYFVGIHMRFMPQQWPIVINLTDEHQHLRQLLGKRYAWFYR
jgi:transposase